MAKVLAKSKDEIWKEGVRAIDNNIDAMRDDLHDKGWTDEAAIQSVLNGERAEMMDELSRNMEGDFSNPYEFKHWPDLNNKETQDEAISPEEREEAANDLSDDNEMEDVSAAELDSPIPENASASEENSEEHADDLLWAWGEEADDPLAEDNSEQKWWEDDLTDSEGEEDSTWQEEQASDLSAGESAGEYAGEYAGESAGEENSNEGESFSY